MAKCLVCKKIGTDHDSENCPNRCIVCKKIGGYHDEKEIKARGAIDAQLKKTPSGCLTDVLPHLDLWVARWFFDKFDVNNEAVGKMFFCAQHDDKPEFIKWLKILYDIESVYEYPENLKTSCGGNLRTGWVTQNLYITKKI